MYAVIKTGGKQYRVSEGDKLVVERLNADVGAMISLDEVLLLGGEDGVTAGAPTVDGASVTAELLELRKGKKIKVFKKRRRQNYRRTRGHRQYEALIRIAEIVAPGAKPKVKAEKPAPMSEAKAEAKPAAKTSEAKPAAKKAEPKKAEPKKAEPKKAAKAEAAPRAEKPAKAAPKKQAAAKEAGADDLTKLDGVGPAFAKKLNEAGVTSFAQIAGWNAAEIERLDGEISGLKTKADKGDWVAEAKKLAGS